MEQISLLEAAKALGATADTDAVFDRVAIDNRKVQPGALFVCIRGERFDGHDFAPLAALAGASAVMAEHPVDAGCPQILVKETLRSLLELDVYYLRRF